jgi:hypothetical protein
MNRDGLSSVQIKKAHSPYYYDGNTAWMTAIIDTQGFDWLYFAIAAGTLVDSNATFAVLMQESDDSGFATPNDVADADMVSQTRGTAPETAASFQFDDDDEVRSIGYIGSKRYVRLYITPAGNTGYANVSVTAHLGRAAHEPITHGAS